jgi:hypothetical protein
MMAKVKVQVPENVTYAANGTVYRTGDEVELERDELVEAFIRHGNLVEIKPAKKRS